MRFFSTQRGHSWLTTRTGLCHTWRPSYRGASKFWKMKGQRLILGFDWLIFNWGSYLMSLMINDNLMLGMAQRELLTTSIRFNPWILQSGHNDQQFIKSLSCPGDVLICRALCNYLLWNSLLIYSTCSSHLNILTLKYMQSCWKLKAAYPAPLVFYADVSVSSKLSLRFFCF